MAVEATAGEAWAEEADAERRRRDGRLRNSSSREAIASTRWPLRYLLGLFAVILFVAAPALVVGPTTLAALLNSLQMGFRTLAIQKRA